MTMPDREQFIPFQRKDELVYDALRNPEEYERWAGEIVERHLRENSPTSLGERLAMALADSSLDEDIV